MRDWKKPLAQILIGALVGLAVLYLADSIVFSIRMTRKTAYSQVSVDQFLATPLKGNKMEYDYNGTVPRTCSRSIFPRNGNPACWWLRRHASQWQ